MTRIRRTLLSTSLLLAGAGITPLASGQYNNHKQTYQAPVRPYNQAPRPQPNYQPRAGTLPRSQPKNAPRVNNVPAVNNSRQVHQDASAKGPKPSPSHGIQPAATPKVAGAGATSRVGATTTTNALVAGHPSPVSTELKTPTRPAYTLPNNNAISKNLSGPTALDKSVSKSVVQQVNATRSSMSGINSRPLPQGNVLVHPNGALTIQGAGGQQYHLRRDGTVAAFETHGVKTTFRQDGTISAVHTANMNITYGAGGARRVETVRPDNSVLVSTGPRQGYLQRTVVVNNTTVIRRTYVVNNTTYVRTYTTYSFGGVVLEHYVPVVYYTPAFYGWVYYPWQRPVLYRWAFYDYPWYGYYAGYFTPAPVYPTPTLWLTDYSLAQMLDSAYQDRPTTVARGQNSAQADTPISPETKQLLAAQVQQMIAVENKSTGDSRPESKIDGDLPDVVNHPHSVFVVASNLDVSNENGECGLTPGDILEMDAPLPQNAVTADVRVVTSKRMDCPASSKVTVSMEELQEMHNNLRQRVDDGMQVLRASQGSGGIPPAPADAIAPPPRPNYMGDTVPVSGEQIVAMIAEQQQTADTTPQVIQNEFGA
jgi:hypothetical protein